MLIPLSWLKEYVDIKMPFEQFAARMSEVGLTIEVWHKDGEDIIFDPEATPNRPDWLSVVGIAREVAAAANLKFKAPSAQGGPKPKTKLELNYIDNPELCPRTSRVLISGVKVKSSPEWLQKRIKQIGLRPINNLVDITNYVLWMYGNPLHVFDYDKIRGHKMECVLSKGNEDFRSLDGIDYKLPKGAIIIKDLGRVIDLLPLKGGENTAVSNTTTNILLHSIVCDPVLTRRTSQALGLRSDSSAVSERGIDPNGTTKACLKALELILELAGGEVASELIECPKAQVPTWKINITHKKIEDVLGISVTNEKVIKIWESLGLVIAIPPAGVEKQSSYEVTIPTFRGDLKIEEDLIEEVGRIIGYNSFPKTLPASPVPTNPVAYLHDFDFDLKIRQIMMGLGYNESYTYSLTSKAQVENLGFDPEKVFKIINPISHDYEYLRPTLLGNLLDSYKTNQANFSKFKIYEFGKRYQGVTIEKAEEEYIIWSALADYDFFQAKGDLETLIEKIGAKCVIRPSTKQDNLFWMHPGRTAHIETQNGEYLGVIGEVHPSLLAKWGIKDRVLVWGISVDKLKKTITSTKKYSPVTKYPSITEDLSLIIPEKVNYQEVVDTILETNKLVSEVKLIDTHENSKLLRVTFLNKNANLTDKEVAEVKEKILKNLKEELKVTIKV